MIPRSGIEPARKRAPPFSLRLSAEERAQLIAQAKGAPLGAYVKERLFADAPIKVRPRSAIVQDRQALAHALALLGKSDLARNVAALARAAEIGALPVDPDTEAKLLIVCDQVRHIRTMLMIALGLFAEVNDRPYRDAEDDL